MMQQMEPSDLQYMEEALDLARAAAAQGEVPVGAVVVYDGRVVGRGGNRREQDQDFAAHAEFLAMREAAKVLGTWRLSGCTVYVTLEPCPMCAGAIVHARVGRVVIAAPDPRTGAAGSVFDLLRDNHLNHRCQVDTGLLVEESAELIRSFFRARRK